MVRKYLGVTGEAGMGAPGSLDCFLLSRAMDIVRALLSLAVRIFSSHLYPVLLVVVKNNKNPGQGFFLTLDHACSWMKDKQPLYLKYAIGSTVAGQLLPFILLESTFLFFFIISLFTFFLV